MPLVSDQLRGNAEQYPDEVAYRVLGVGEMTYRQWDSAASRLARGYVEAGLEPQERVALLFTPDDALQNLQAYMATHKAGGANVPVNVRLAERELRHVLQHSAPQVIVASQALLDRVRPLLAELPSVRQVVSTGSGDEDAVGWDDFLSGDDTDLQVDLSENDIADILYTSGTTGMPKGVVARHDRATTTPIAAPHEFGGWGWMHASPFFTFAGISFICVPPALGATGVYMPKFDAGAWLEYVEDNDVRMAFLVPAMVELLLDHPTWGEHDLSSLMLVSVGSAPIAPSSLHEFQSELPNASISNSYSMTELGAAYTVMPPGELEKRPGSVGQVFPPLEVKVVHEEDHERELPRGEVGELLIRKEGKQREYFRNEEANESTWTDGGWLRTGDLGKLDEDDFLYIVGRKKDVIIRGGHNVHAGDVENVLHELEEVLDCAVVGIPHKVLGEDIAAYVVPTRGAGLTEADVLAHCEQHLADYKRPRQVHLVDELPRNAMGKVLKRVLVDQHTGLADAATDD